MLRAEDLTVRYGRITALWDVSLEVAEGEAVALLGPNGSGKSSALNAVSGIVRSATGRIEWDGASIIGLPPYRRAELGIAHVLERHRIFGGMSVRDNLALTTESRGSRGPTVGAEIDRVLGYFPRLVPLLDRDAHLLSGGEQQLLAIARGLLMNPRLVMLDEPFLGLSTGYVEIVADVLRQLHQEGIAVLMTEQNVDLTLSICSRGYVVISGELVASGSSDHLMSGDRVRTAFLGETGAALA